MKTSLYLASAESRSGKSALAVGLLAQMCEGGGNIGIFRPVVRDRAHDPLIELLLPLSTSAVDPEAAVGVSYEDVNDDIDTAVGAIVERYHTYAEQHDAVLVIGSDFTGVPTPTEFSVNATIAANLGTRMLLIVPGVDRAASDLITSIDLMMTEASARHAQVAGVVANRCDPDQRDAIAGELAQHLGDLPAYALPEDDLLSAPTVRDVMRACEGSFDQGDEALLDREAMGVIVAAMTMPHVLDRLTEGGVVIVPSDREGILLAVVMAHQAMTFPSLAAVVLNGGFPLSEQTLALIHGLDVELPILRAPAGTMETARAAERAVGAITADAPRKIERARTTVRDYIDVQQVLPTATTSSQVLTPLMFEHRLTARARTAGARVVLPEGMEDRILRAADTVLARGIADLTLLGIEDDIRARATSLGLDISRADVIDPASDERREAYADTYAELRAHKGVTTDQARDVVADPSYFGTLMVHAGDADGMVSGSITTTAATIRPALEIIKTADGVSVVSSVFFMCLADRVLAYGDCAINPMPNAEQLADIAISSAATAETFGLDPLVAMLSYSTGGSGRGADVEKVREATALVHERQPELEVEGPIQYDAAVDPAVAATKLKDSTVAGRASVLIFPDLNTGNNTYKAVQRSASAVAIGPVLQGLRKPVNDLSRGSTVRDIVNTIAITAIQAKG
ncbi:MAG: phosphate acetyltransferase [Ornithinimicrobium sp.]